MNYKRKIKHTDKELVVHYQKDRNKKWVGELYQRYAHLVLGVCLKYLQNKEKAQDATAAIFEELFDKLLGQNIENFGSWMYTFSKNYCLMEIRKKKTKKHGVEMGNHLSIDQVSLANQTDEIQAKGLREIALSEMEAALDKLPDDQKQCITLFYLHEMSYNQVSSQTGMSLKKVKSAIQNGKRNLKNALIKKK